MSERFEALTICDLDDTSVKLNKQHVRRIGKKLEKSGAKYVSIISCMGSWRTGKSFICRLLIRYLNLMEANQGKLTESDPDWRYMDEDTVHPAWVNKNQEMKVDGYEGNEKGLKRRLSRKGFEWRGGVDRCTEGVWLYEKPYVFDWEGEKLAVLVMDTQGAWDTSPPIQTMTILGLTVLLSSKVLYNLKGNLVKDKIDSLNLFAMLAKKARHRIDTNNWDSRFSHIQFLLRDFQDLPELADLSQCEELMQKHLQDFLAAPALEEDAKKLDLLFKSIDLYALCNPGRRVCRAKYDGEIDEIEPDFLHLAEGFFRRFLGQKFPVPSTTMGKPLEVSQFVDVISGVVDAFAAMKESSNLDMNLADFFTRSEIQDESHRLQDGFVQALYKAAPNESVLSPAAFDEKASQLKQEYGEKFDEVLATVGQLISEDAREEYVRRFEQTIDQSIGIRLSELRHQLKDGHKMLAQTTGGTVGGIIILNFHPIWIICASVGGLVFWHVNTIRKQERVDESGKPELVPVSMMKDYKDVVIGMFTIKFWKKRKGDCQAMWIALNNINANATMEKMKMLTKVGEGLVANRKSQAEATNEVVYTNEVK